MKTFSMIFLAVLLSVAASLTQASSAFASSEGERFDILTVSATGEVKVAATVATISLAVETTGKTAEEAQKDAARRANAVVAFLKGESVQNLQTTQVSLSPEYRFDQGKNTLIGHRAVQSLSFETSAADAGRLVDHAVAKGATRVDALSFRADEDSRQKAETLALRRAAENARARAKTVLEALGLTWQRIAFLDVDPLPTLSPLPKDFRIRAMSAEAASAAPPSPTLGGEETVRVSLQMGVAYR